MILGHEPMGVVVEARPEAAWQAVEFAAIPPDGSVTVFGLGPVGQFSARIARHRGAWVIGVDYVPERREMARRHGAVRAASQRPTRCIGFSTP